MLSRARGEAVPLTRLRLGRRPDDRAAGTDAAPLSVTFGLSEAKARLALIGAIHWILQYWRSAAALKRNYDAA